MYIHTVNIGSTLALDLNKFQMKGKSSIIYRLLVLASVCMGMFAAASCVQMEIEEYPEIGEGISDVRFDVEFRPLDSVDPATRTAGDAVRHINSVHVVVYKTDGTLFSNHSFADVNTSEQNTSGVTLTPPGGSSGFAEATYCRASFDLQLPLGEYRIYAIANYTPTDAQMASEEALKAISFTWNTNVAKNNAMFGYFTNGEQSVPSYDSSKPAGNRFAAPTIRIDRSNLTLHAWVRRIVSKVTVGFDGTNLNENIFIYIHSVQVKDIPSVCYLGKDNKPDADYSELIQNGETIQYRSSSQQSANTSLAGLVITKGEPYGGRDNGDVAEGSVHHERSNALYLFENLQGTSTDKHTYKNYDSKDNKGYGSYIEVKGYYSNKNVDNASEGSIIYRFMLGKDVTTDFNVERGDHYKLTLCFKKDANDPDWHIEYEHPPLVIPSPLYISYGYNEYLDIPIIARGGNVTSFKAQIVDNDWGYPEHKYYAYQTENRNGFLSFRNQKGTITDTDRAAWDTNGKTVTAATTSSSETTSAGIQTNMTLRVYTRPLTLGGSFTGHNPFTGHQRKAKIKFTVVIGGVTQTLTTEVIQVRRAVNPAGIWRSGDKQTPFNVTLMEMDGEDTGETGYLAKDFFPTKSDGPWTAEIIEGKDWVQIKAKDSSTWGTKNVVGSTGSAICFDYRPGSTISNTSYRSGVIRVLYHNNTCVHYIFVSQGLGTVNLAGTQWHTRNVEYNGKLVNNPLLEGCMFKFGDSNKAFLPENNLTYGWKVETDRANNRKPYKVYDTYQKTTPTLLTNANYETAVFDPSGFTSMNVEGGVPPTKAQWVKLESLRRYYGVMYGDECTETITRTVAQYDPSGTDAYMYMAEGQTKGMQGVFIWDDSRGGNHTFFPLSSTGFGHRKASDLYSYSWGLNPANIKYGVLQYGQRSYYFPETSTGWDGKGDGITMGSALPVYYDLWLRKGVIYWYRTRSVMSGEDGSNDAEYDYAHDFNYFTMGFDTYGANNLERSSTGVTTDCDLCFVRCVVN